jgi:Tfp pilus assembly protein PilF
MTLVQKLASSLSLSLICINAYCSDGDFAKEKSELLKRKPGLTSKITHKRLERAFLYARHEKFDSAISVLIDLIKQTEKRPDEYAQAWQHLGFILAQKGDMPKAIKALENSINAKGLAYQQTLSSLYTLGQLYFSEEKYGESEKIMTRWFALVDAPQPESYILMASILSQLEKKEEALKYLNQAIISSVDPQEKWLQFALALNHELKNYQNSLKLLAILTSKFPQTDKYWKQFYGTYLTLNEESKALATMELAYKLGHVKEEAELVNMASLYVFLDMPYKGAKFFENELVAGRISKTFKNYDFLSQAWSSAKEKSKSFLALNEAASLAPKGDLYARQGFMLLEEEKWNEALQSLNAGLKKGGLAQPEKIYFAMGIAKYHQKDLLGALNMLQKARTINSDDKSVLRWIDQLKNEMHDIRVSQI